MEIDFATEGNKIHLPIMEVLLRASDRDLARLKNQRDWTPHNDVLLPPFLTEAAILDGESDVGELLNFFSSSVTERADEGGDASGD